VISSSDFCSATSRRSAITSLPLERREIEPFVHGDDVGQAGTAAHPVQSALEQQVRYGGRLDRHSVSRSMYPWDIGHFPFSFCRSPFERGSHPLVCALTLKPLAGLLRRIMTIQT
jgi:hypothetical protein